MPFERGVNLVGGKRGELFVNAGIVGQCLIDPQAALEADFVVKIFGARSLPRLEQAGPGTLELFVDPMLPRARLVLFGDSPVERWRPWGVEHRVLRPDSRDLADLPLAPVLGAVRDLSG